LLSVISINPQELKGDWLEGWALDLHTVVSRYDSRRGRYWTIRTPLGEMIYNYKYHRQWWLKRKLARTAAEFLIAKDVRSNVQCLVLVPPRRFRLLFQPVRSLGKRIGKMLHLPVETRILRFRKRLPELKTIEDPVMRAKLVKNMFTVKSRKLSGHSVLLFDDLYRSGMSLNEAARALRDEGGVRQIRVLTMTRTRTKR
jgi:competence protein ComFC